MRIDAIKLFRNNINMKGLGSFGQFDSRMSGDAKTKNFEGYKQNAMCIGVAASVLAVMAAVLWFVPIILKRR